MSSVFQRPKFIAISWLLAGASVTPAFPQSTPTNIEAGREVQSLTLSSVDFGVATDSGTARLHMMPVRGKTMKQDSPADSDTGTGSPTAAIDGAANTVATGIRFYPADLGNPFNNTTIAAARNHSVYLNALPSVWGYPARLLEDLSKSDFIHVTDQYVNTTADDRYTVGYPAFVVYPNAPHTLVPDDIFAILHLAAGAFGTGYEDVYHVFISPGTDI